MHSFFIVSGLAIPALFVMATKARATALVHFFGTIAWPEYGSFQEPRK
jgi:hypothetical protein